jgi:TatD DNase family protein
MEDFRYIDIHSHVNDSRFDADLPEVLARMRGAGVASIVVGTDREMSERAIAFAETHTDLWATIGQHPTDKHEEIFDDEWYGEQAKHPRVVAIGECGLDYYWPEHDKWPNGEQEEKNRQRGIHPRGKGR